MDQAFKAFQKLKKKESNNYTSFRKTMTSLGQEDMRHNKLDYLLLSKQVDTLCSQVIDLGISNGDEMAKP